ncbi:MAG: SpoIVB peptidase [Clostridia bacterium]|nr:SpoIVB peptidase [Clostridia bacterium]
MLVNVNPEIEGHYSRAGLFEFFANVFGANSVQREMPEVYLGGIPLGFTINCNGVVVIAVGGVHTKTGLKKTIVSGHIEPGDVVVSINGKQISSSATISEEIKKQEQQNKEVTLGVKRGENPFSVNVLPALDIITGEYKLGLWIRDNSAGVGTLTYVIESNHRFGALGHSVCDIDTGTKLPVLSGNVYRCNIIGVSESKRGSAGELKGLFLRNGKVLGTIDKNTEDGVYGNASDELISSLKTKLKVATKKQVKTGRASIFCSIDGSEAHEYKIEIIKASHHSQSSNKNLVIRIIDQELLSKTGGIVQGMSGSPIVQNGMLVGAVTHVFLSDPTKGYGILAENMIDN